MSELTVGTLSGLASNSFEIDIATGSTLDLVNAKPGSIPKAALPAGSILQVNQSLITSTFSTTSSSFVDVTGMTVSITPTSATSKILVSVIGVLGTGGDTNAAVSETEVVRNDSRIGGDVIAAMAEGASVERSRDSSATIILDSPATTSALTYKVRMRSPNSITAWWGRSGGSSKSVISSITVMEIAA